MLVDTHTSRVGQTRASRDLELMAAASQWTARAEGIVSIRGPREHRACPCCVVFRSSNAFAVTDKVGGADPEDGVT